MRENINYVKTLMKQNNKQQAIKMTVKKIHNERGAGRKPNPYKTKLKRIPSDLESEIDMLIAEYKKQFANK